MKAFRLATGAAIALAGLVSAGGALRAQELPFALELDGTRVPLGSTVELVARTTGARGLASAAFAFEVRDRDGEPAVAFASLDSFALLGGGAGSTIDATFDAASQRLEVTAISPDFSLNSVLGPLAVFRFTLDPAVELDDRFEVWLDPGATLVDAAAQPVLIVVGRADLRIVEEEPGEGLGALGGEAYPGGQVVLGAMTDRPFAIGGGTIELLYDATLFEGPPVVVIDPRYGSATIDTVGNPEPGHLIVEFTSTGDLNLVLHGAFFQVVLRALESVPVGTVTTVSLGAATALVDALGAPIALEVDGEELDFIDPELVAAAGFEGGNLAEWFTVVQ